MKFCKLCSKWHDKGQCKLTEKLVAGAEAEVAKMKASGWDQPAFASALKSELPEETSPEVAASVRYGSKNPAGCSIIGIKYGTAPISSVVGWEEKKVRAFGTFFFNHGGLFLEQVDSDTVLVIESPHTKDGRFTL